jgi:S-adenosylmethionine hydrolase
MIAIKHFSTINAAFNIRLFSEIYPPDKTLFVVVVSGLNSNPERIFGQTKNGLTFVGNNSGYFSWLAQDLGLEYIYQNITTREVDGKSFGGKYVQIPTAAKIIANIPLEQIGIQKTNDFLADLPIKEGTVVHCDNFGLMKLKAPKLTNFYEGEKLKFFVNNVYAVDGIYTEKMKQQKDNTWVLFTGSSLSGLPELGKVRSQNSAKELNVIEGDVISWERATHASAE